jgi:hypothetical protein
LRARARRWAPSLHRKVYAVKINTLGETNRTFLRVIETRGDAVAQEYPVALKACLKVEALVLTKYETVAVLLEGFDINDLGNAFTVDAGFPFWAQRAFDGERVPELATGRR